MRGPHPSHSYEPSCFWTVFSPHAHTQLTNQPNSANTSPGHFAHKAKIPSASDRKKKAPSDEEMGCIQRRVFFFGTLPKFNSEWIPLKSYQNNPIGSGSSSFPTMTFRGKLAVKLRFFFLRELLVLPQFFRSFPILNIQVIPGEKQ